MVDSAWSAAGYRSENVPGLITDSVLRQANETLNIQH